MLDNKAMKWSRQGGSVCLRGNGFANCNPRYDNVGIAGRPIYRNRYPEQVDDPMDLNFERFPASYRLSQRLMFVVLVALASSAFGLMAKLPVGSRVGIAICCSLIVVFSLTLAAYVVVRYPYISLVHPVDGDPFGAQVGRNLRWLTLVLKLIAIVFLAMASTLILLRGVDSSIQAVFLAYSALMIPVLIYLTFWYEPTRHPTVATLIRSTFGFGLVLFPLFLPFVMVGSSRCRRLLASVPTGESSG